MHSTRKIIRAFLASPGDLQEERNAIRDVVDEFNESWADELGYQIELIGWEETVAGYGRPQELINQDLERCELFLGMIWKRWGTPPDRDGNFSSGFEEEFELSIARREEKGSPEISLFFKQIPDEYMIDPGNDLKKVLEFRKKIIADKKILFQNFSTVQDLESLVRKRLNKYVISAMNADESSESEEMRAINARIDSEKNNDEEREHELAPLPTEGVDFLESLVNSIKQPDSLDMISSSDVARFRLLANSISKPGNEVMSLGVHDINILYASSLKGVELSKQEARELVQLGFQHLTNENIPLWHWYSALSDSIPELAVFSSVTGVNENEKVGAISVMTALALEIPKEGDSIQRDWIFEEWFSADSSDRVKTAALGYLAKCGTAADLKIAREEYARGNNATSRNALECTLEILIRIGQTKNAQELLLESQFESLNTDLLRLVLKGLDGLKTSLLLLGLDHRNFQVRLQAIKLLHSRGELDISMAERLIKDSNAHIRRVAIDVLKKLGKSVSLEEAKSILLPPQKQPKSSVLGLGGTAISDQSGEKLFQQYHVDVLKNLPEAELKSRVKTSLAYDDAAYFALVQKYFRRYVDELRRNVDDRFEAYFEERINRMYAHFGDNAACHDLISKTKDLGEYSRKELTRQGLNVLCAAKRPDDLHRVRANLRDGFAEASPLDVEYMGKHGEWTDLPILANAKAPSFGLTILHTMSKYEEFQVEVAKAMLLISKKYSISALLSLEMSNTVLKRIIELCPESRFAQVSRDTLLTLFNHESGDVRKAAATMAVKALPAKHIKTILREYVGNENYRYYNVIHWLDLGASMRRDDARKVARAAGS